MREKENTCKDLGIKQKALKKEVVLYRERMRLIVLIIQRLLAQNPKGGRLIDALPPSFLDENLKGVFGGSGAEVSSPQTATRLEESEVKAEEVEKEEMEELDMAIEGLEEAKQQLHWIKKRYYLVIWPSLTVLLDM